MRQSNVNTNQRNRGGFVQNEYENLRASRDEHI